MLVIPYQGWEQWLDPKGGVYYYHPTPTYHGQIAQHPFSLVASQGWEQWLDPKGGVYYDHLTPPRTNRSTPVFFLLPLRAGSSG